MRALPFLALPFLVMLVSPVLGSADAPDVRIVEVVADPLSDWNGDGKLTASDEYVEVVFEGPTSIDLSGWSLRFNDTSPTSLDLAGTLDAGQRRVIINPPGEINNNAHVALVAPDGKIVDEVRFGSWAGSRLPSADATNETDEALSFVDGAWRRWHATPNLPNTEPRWILTSAWEPGPVDGWWSPSTTGNLHARAIHAGVRIGELELQSEQNGTARVLASTVAGEPVRVNAAAGLLRWVVPGTVWNATVANIRVDDFPPIIIAPTGPMWLRPGSSWTPTLFETKSGANEIQWRTVEGNENAWSVNITPPADWPHETLHSIQVRARDRVGNVGPWSENITVGVDPTPPSLTSFHADAQRRLFWRAENTTGAPLVAWELRRLHENATNWTLDHSVFSFEDNFNPGRAPLAYELRARDAAGNRGTINTIYVDHEGLHPRVLGIRIGKPFWGSGTQEVRIDFDRRMSTTSPVIQVGVRTLDDGRWLANASTFYFALPSVEDIAEGTVHVQVVDATSADRAALLRPTAAFFHVDRQDPQLDAVPSGWTNLPSVLLQPSDASPLSVSWKLWNKNDPEPAAWNGTITTSTQVALAPAGTWVLKASAKDAAGNTATLRREYTIDRSQPTMNIARIEDLGRTLVEIADAGSGVQWNRVTWNLPANWSARLDAPRHRVIIDDNPRAESGVGRIIATDHAGNNVSLEFELTPRGSADLANDAASSASSRLDEALRAGPDVPEDEASRGTGMWWAAGLLGGSAASIPLVRRARRRKPRPPSFARRIRLAKKGESAP